MALVAGPSLPRIAATFPNGCGSPAALAALYPTGDPASGFVLKHQGWEVLDEGVTLAAAGAVDGSIFLLTHRRRRPVR